MGLSRVDLKGHQDEVELEGYEEEKDLKPTKQELEYLELRQQLKEAFRKRMKQESYAGLGHSQEAKILRHDSYGSFFGPSQPVIAQRVILESKAMLKNKTISKLVAGEINPDLFDLKFKVQKLRDSRDYSFLLSDDAKFPAPIRKSPPGNFSDSDPELKLGQLPSKIKLSKSVTPWKVSNCIQKANSKMPVSNPDKVCQKSPIPGGLGASFTKLMSGTNQHLEQERKHHEPKKAGLPKHPITDQQNPPLSKFQSAIKDEKKAKGVSNQLQSSKCRVPDRHNVSLSKTQYRSKLHLENKKELPEDNRDKVIPKELHSSSKYQLPQGHKAPMSKSHSVTNQHMEDKAKAMPRHQQSSSKTQSKRSRQEDTDEEDGDISSIIRRLFRYDPKRFEGVNEDDDNIMESNFNEIMKEEKRSAIAARKEDAIELLRMEQEERERRD